MRKEVYYIFMTFMVELITTQFKNGESNECTTPKKEAGVCINILNCQALQSTILEYRKNIESYNLIRASFCGYQGRVTKICCPLDLSAPDLPQPEISSNNEEVLPSTSTCGKVGINHDRIVGGKPAELGAWPWIAVLGYQLPNRKDFGTQWACGGSLITNRHILTAAHCVYPIQGRKLVVVRLGELNLNPAVSDGANPLDVPIEQIIPHEGYDEKQLVNDIALLKLKHIVTFNKFIQPICLLRLSDINNINFAKSTPYVAGWGSTNSNPINDLRYPPNTALMEVQIPIVNWTECKKLYEKEHYSNVIDQRTICAGYPKGGKDSCRGDSGGPLMWPVNKQYFLMAVVSYGTQICGRAGFPGVYSSVPSFIDWIEEKTQL